MNRLGIGIALFYLLLFGSLALWESMNKQHFNEDQKNLLRQTFNSITEHCKDTNNPNNESHRKELNRLINYNIRFGAPLERAVDDSYWSVMEAIDVENQLALEV